MKLQEGRRRLEGKKLQNSLPHKIPLKNLPPTSVIMYDCTIWGSSVVRVPAGLVGEVTTRAYSRVGGVRAGFKDIGLQE